MIEMKSTTSSSYDSFINGAFYDDGDPFIAIGIS